MEEGMEYSAMLDELLAEYPAAKEEVEALKGALEAEMPMGEEEPELDEMPELPPMPMLGGEDMDEEVEEEDEDEEYEDE
jgi:hypothetical protein